MRKFTERQKRPSTPILTAVFWFVWLRLVKIVGNEWNQFYCGQRRCRGFIRPELLWRANHGAVSHRRSNCLPALCRWRRDGVELPRFSRGELLETIALSASHFLGCSVVGRLSFSISVCPGTGRHCQSRSIGLPIQRFLGFHRLLDPLALPFTGRSRSLLGHRFLRKVQTQGHQPRRRPATLEHLHFAVCRHYQPVLDGLQIRQ